MQGAVVAAADQAWAEARLPWARAVAQRPAAVASPVDADDVAAVLAVAREHGATVAVQPTGHGAVDALEGAIVLRMDAFDAIVVDAETRTARVGAGVLVGDLLAALDGTGLVGPSGSSRIVSVAGLVLGGGQGWFSRLGGLGGEWLVRAHVVLPGGTTAWIADDDEALRLLRGGAGLVAVATELELALQPVADLRGGTIDVPIEHSAAMLRAAATLVDAAPGLALSVALLAMPDSPVLPEAIRGRSWCSVHVVLADVDEAALAPLRAVPEPLRDDVAPIAPGALHTIAGDPEQPGAGTGWSALVPRLDDATIDALVAARAEPALAPVVAIEVRLLGGTAPERPSLVPQPSEPWILSSIAPMPPGTDGEAQRAAVASLADRLAPVTNDRTLPTFLAGGPLSRALPPAAVAELHAWRDAHGGDVLHPSRLPR
ncbi:FAD/FMN-containing dehydrogenase [Agrococcus jejuensis]|uniref:FAD/FMN-containing dehydrogenase n=2 Tax=Agrococcus jejuensis TaxID=399736 RepID=A0A1G8GGT1_9MICO|nr:FAD/FMN-containing dehydrogenase [Agrococcus jejuensis]